MEPSTYVEIGIYEGETFKKVKADKKIAVDINKGSLDQLEDLGDIMKIHGDSNTLYSHLLKTQELVDLLFIDADHQETSVMEDFQNIEGFMSPLGVVLFHDTFPGTVQMSSPKFCGDGFLAIPKLRMKYPNWSFITIPVHPGLTIATRTDALPVWYTAS
jgi:predicted O-methyltransferase YrrM